MLPQKEAERLMKILKKINQPELFQFPKPSGKAFLEIVSENNREEFPTSVHRGEIEPMKASYNMRYKSSDNIILYRLDINCTPHKNPDGEKVPSPHLHIYREGSNADYAIPAPGNLSQANDPCEALIDFLEYCKIMNVKALAVQGDLFS